MNQQKIEKRNLLILHINPLEKKYHNDDPFRWAKRIGSKYNHTETLYLQSELYHQKSWGNLFKKISEMLIKNKINDVLYLPGYSDYEFTELIFKRLSIKYQNINFISFFLDEMIAFTSHYRYIAIYSDLIISTELVNQNHYQALGTDFIFFYSAFKNIEKYASSKSIKFNKEKKYDISFIGDVREKNNRISYIKAIPLITKNFFIAGPGTKKGELSKSEYLKVINNSKITLNFSGTACGLDSPWLLENEYSHLYGANKGRILQSILLDSYPLSEKSITAELTFGRNLETFESKEELIMIAKTLLKNNSHREKKVSELKKFVLKNLNSNKQFSNIYKKLNIIKSKNLLYKKDIYKSKDYEIIFTLRIIAYSLNSLKKLNLLLFISSFFKLFQINILIILLALIKALKYFYIKNVSKNKSSNQYI